MWINMLVRTYAWIGLLSEGGLIQRLLGFFGLGDEESFYIRRGQCCSAWSTISCRLWYCRSIRPCARWIIRCWRRALIWGQIRVQTFIRVTLPMSLPGVINGITLVFLPAVSSFFIPKLLGGGQYFLIGNLIENQFITVGEWNFGSAISMIMAAIMMLLMMAGAQGRDSQPRRKGGVGPMKKGKTFLWEDSDGTDDCIFFYLPIVYMVIFSFNSGKSLTSFHGIFSALVPAYDGIAHDDGVSVYDIQYCADRDG